MKNKKETNVSTRQPLTQKNPPKPPLRLPNGFGAICLLRGNRRRPYVAKLPSVKLETGKWYQEIIGYYESWYSAYNALIKYHAGNIETKDTPPIKPKSITLYELYEEWIGDPFTHQKYNHRTVLVYKSVFMKLKELHERNASEITGMTFSTFLSQSGFTAPLQHRIRAALVCIYQYGISRNLVDRNPAQSIEVLVPIVRKPRRLFNKEEIAILQALPKSYARDTLLFLLYTGMRPNELAKLEMENIRLHERYLIAGSKTTAGRNRHIPLCEEAVDSLCYLTQNGTRFIKKRNVDTMRKHCNALLTKLGINHMLYECRHTFISQAQICGISDVMIKKIVGHKGTVTENVYTHFSVSVLRQEIAKFHY